MALAAWLSVLLRTSYAAFFATWLFLHCRAMHYGKQVGFFAMLGLFAGFVSPLQGGIWMGMAPRIRLC